MQKQLDAKCEEFESRVRRNNLRIYSVPERCEENNVITFVENILREKLDVKIESAHRVGPYTRHNECQRSIIVCFQNFNTKHKVLQAAWAKRDIRVNDHRIYFDEDFTAQVFVERAK